MKGRNGCAAARVALAARLTVVALTAGCGDPPPPPEASAAPVKLYTVGSGESDRRSAYAGEIVPSEGAPDAAPLRIIATLPARDVAGGQERLRGLDADAATAEWEPEVVLESMPDRVFPARVEALAARADSEPQLLEATFAFEGVLDVRVSPGMSARVRLALGPADAANGLHIPARAALADESGEPYVWRVDPRAMTVVRARVELGEPHRDRIAIVDGLVEGDVIAVSGLQQLRDGMPVARLEE